MCNAPASFQAITNAIFWDFIDEGWLMVYMDDIIVHTTIEESLEDYWRKVHKVLDHLEEHNLYLCPSKCSFEQKENPFLGIIVSYETLAMDLKKLDVIANWEPPRDVRGMWRFLGFMGFYRHFIIEYSEVVQPLLSLTRKAAT